MKSLIQFINTILLVLNFVVVVGLLISIASPLISPNTFLYPAFFGISFPFWVFFNITFLIYWIITLNWYALLPLAGLIFSYPTLSDYVPMHVQKSEVPSPYFKVLSYNCMGLAEMQGSDSKGKNILEYIVSTQADIVCLQEFQIVKSGNSSRSEAAIRKALKVYPYYKFVEKRDNFGLACFSKYPITNVVQLDFKSQSNQAAAFTIKIEGEEIVVVNNHLESNHLNSEDKAIYSKAVTTLNTESIEGVRNTLFKKLADSYRVRAKQAERVRSFMDKQTKKMIVCGDFNDTQVSYSYRELRKGMRDAFADTGFGFGTTFNRDYFFFRIDHMLYSPSLNAFNCKIDRVKYSDHYPVSCYFTLK